MSLLRYLKPKDGLPHPKRSLSTVLPSQAIAQANLEVQAAQMEKKRRGPYKRYSPSVRAAIGKYACNNGVSAAAHFYSRKLNSIVSETTVRSIKSAYVEGLRENRREDGVGEITSLPTKPQGRPLLLGKDLDDKVLAYIRKVREGGGGVSARIATAATRGIVMSCDKHRLTEFGGHVQINRFWAHSLLKRMKFVKRKAATSKSKHTPEDFARLKQSFLADVVTTVAMEEIPAELILNWDQTGIKIVPYAT